MGFPPSSDDVEVAVRLAPEQGGRERWTRDFGGKVFSSLQSCGSGKNQYLLVERFGVVCIALALVIREERLLLIPRRWSICGLPLPKRLVPGGNSFEAEENGQFHFDVEIRVPVIGLIVGYRGQLVPER
jgi:hypothetical protein